MEGIQVNVLDAYNCDTELLSSLFERTTVVGDRVDLPDGIYTNIDDEVGAVIIGGRFIAELDVYNDRGESRG